MAARDPFEAFPKQSAILPPGFSAPPPWNAAPVRAEIAGRRVIAAPAVPVVPIRSAEGEDLGVLIGWAILDGRLLGEGDEARLPPGGSVEADLLPDLAGRAACLWDDGSGPALELDSGGFLPMVFAADAGIVAATSTLLAALSPRPVAEEIAEIYDFPARRGYLPFRLAHHQGVRRLLPGRRLDLETFEAPRVWPSPALAAAPRLGRAEAETAVQAIAERLRVQAGAVADATVRAGGVPRLNLTAGADSRLVLAALRPWRETLLTQTFRHRFGAFGLDNALDVHVAGALARRAGARHETVAADVPSGPAALDAWLERTGRTTYEAVADLAPSLERADREALTLDGVGTEFLRAITWAPEDLDLGPLDRDRLLARLRLPPARPILEEAEFWLDELPPCDGLRALDAAKIDLMHACWAATPVYGAALPVPTLSPFPSRRNHDAVMALPDAWRLSGGAWRAAMEALWPELAVPALNRAEGWARLRFFPVELKARTPKRLKRLIRPYR